ncbi:MAG: DUF58 domain-containing protein [Fastidiosipilaceae bacterium]|nr:DUF58 domain-containing protein [Clostridiaceae bacterium]
MFISWLIWIVLCSGAVVYSLTTATLSAILFLGFIVLVPLLTILFHHIIKPHISWSVDCPDSGEKKNTLYGSVRAVNHRPLIYRQMRLDITMKNMLTGEEQKLPLRSALYAKSTQGTDFRLLSKHCGTIRISGKSCRLYDFFGLTYRTVSLNVVHDCVILPDILPLLISLPEVLAMRRDSDFYAGDRPGSDVSEIFDFRDYVPGDQLNHIQWKLSEKHDRLIVKRGSYPLDESLRLWMNAGRSTSPQALEEMAETTISISQSLCEAKQRHELLFREYGQEDLSRYKVEDEGDLMALLSKLLSAGPSKCEFTIPFFDDQPNYMLVTADPDLAAAAEEEGLAVVFTEGTEASRTELLKGVSDIIYEYRKEAS